MTVKKCLEAYFTEFTKPKNQTFTCINKYMCELCVEECKFRYCKTGFYTL